MFERTHCQLIKTRLREPRKFLQVVLGPRQVGKTTAVKQALQTLGLPFLFFSADAVPAVRNSWLSECWESARAQMRITGAADFVLVIDEIQKIRNWSEIAKREWDADSFNDVGLKVLLLGSSRVLIEKGLSESLAGRFEEIRMPHWSFPEMRDAFGFSAEQFAYFGAYPGAAALVADEDRWRNYVSAAIIDASINKDILMDSPVSKPALLRQTFELASAYSGQILSLTKMLGQLQDAGNTTTLSGYLNLLSAGGLLCGLRKFASDFARRRAAAPKFQVFNNALKSAYLGSSFDAARANGSVWGRIFESAIGAHLVSRAFSENFEVFFWRDRDAEVDFVLKKRERLVAIEVKSNAEAQNSGLAEFCRRFAPHRAFVVGAGGVPAEEFLSASPLALFD